MTATFARSRTRIICTIGPACRSPEKLRELMLAGMDIARLHFSYADHREHAENIHRLRQAAASVGKDLQILQDLSGTKVRLRNLTNPGVVLEEGADFSLVAPLVKGDAKRASVNLPEWLSVVAPGDTILLADGSLRLEARQIQRRAVRCKVVVGGRIKSGQAVLAQGKSAPVSVPTAKDLDDVHFGLREGVDWIAQSFVSSAHEVVELRRFLKSHGAHTPVIAKIERPEALAHLSALIQAADAIMVARGDLGLTTPLEEIAFTQKDIIRRARAGGKLVITATEMLFSMMQQPQPTRAEVTDITNAILDGSDAVMLSGESALGKYPVEATRMLARIAAVADAHARNVPRASPAPAHYKSRRD